MFFSLLPSFLPPSPHFIPSAEGDITTMVRHTLFWAVFAACLTTHATASSYFTATTHVHEINPKSVLHVRLNSLASYKSMVYLSFHDIVKSFPFLDSEAGAEDLGSALLGEKLRKFALVPGDLSNMTCQPINAAVPDGTTLSGEETKSLVGLIEKDYRYRLSLELMKAFVVGTLSGKDPATFDECAPGSQGGDAKMRNVRMGLPVCEAAVPEPNPEEKKEGEKEEKAEAPKAGKRAMLYTHFKFVIDYTKPQDRLPYVTGLTVVPTSRSGNCDDSSELYITEGEEQKVFWTYSTEWVQGDVKWSNRWENYMESTKEDEELRNSQDSVTSSLLLIGCLTLLVAVIIMRTLHLDFTRYNNPDNEDEMQEEVGWKLVHTDVFRPPSRPNLFAIVIGTGVQVVGMILSGLLLSFEGFASPSMRGRFVSLILIIFALLAVMNGYVCGRIQMMFGVKQWKTPIASALCFPGFVFFLWGFAECLIASRAGSVGVSAGYWMLILVQWWGISLPLVVIGMHFSKKKPYYRLSKRRFGS